MRRISEAASELLLENIIPFWKGLKDEQYGGFYGYLDRDLNLDKQADKGCILHSRILWFFSEAALLLKRDDMRACAEHAYEFVRRYCIDTAHGGIFWSVTYDGKVADSTKHTYNQAFAIYALSSYYRLTGDEEAINLAIGLFDIIEEKCTDEVGYLEAFTADWKPESNEKLSENGVVADKTMNTLLHVFEGYSGLFQAKHDARVKAAMERILDIYINKIYDSEQHRQRVFFDANYNSIIDLYSYGHDIESSWLIDWGCGLLGDNDLTRRVSKINQEMAEAVFKHAYSRHSFANECDRGIVNESRVWWVQSEAIIGLINLWKKNPEHTEYKDAVPEIYNYIVENLIDKREGSEWFWSVDLEGKPDSDDPIAGPWKCPYHNGRMCMELIRRDEEIYV